MKYNFADCCNEYFYILPNIFTDKIDVVQAF